VCKQLVKLEEDERRASKFAIEMQSSIRKQKNESGIEYNALTFFDF